MSSKQSSSKTKKKESYNKMFLTSRVNNGMSSADIQQLGDSMNVPDAKAITMRQKTPSKPRKI